MTAFTFNVDEQIFLRNDKTNKVYTLTINRTDRSSSYDVTREWTVPNQTQLAQKTDRFMMFKQAAQFMEKHYNERIANGYIEVMRKTGVIKKAAKIESHKGTEIVTVDDKTTVTGPTQGQKIENMIQSRHRTTIHERINFTNTPKK